MEEIAARYAANSIRRMMSFETKAEQDAYMLGIEDMKNLAEDLKEEKEGREMDEFINSFLFDNEEG